MSRLLAAAAAAALALATPAAADPTEVYCREIRARLHYVATVCLAADPDGPSVTWECELRTGIDCSLPGSTR